MIIQIVVISFKCKSLGILFGTNMGSYHSYVGDMKLEDSKDNWYRVSGLNISRWNFTTWGNVGRSLWDYASGGGFVLAKAGRGLAGKSHWSDLLYKALKQDDALTLTRGVSTPTGVVDGFVRFIWTSGDNNMDSLDIAGNSFDFKNRLTKTEGAADSLMLNCTTATGGLYGKASTLFFNMYNIESTLHANNYYFRDTPIEPDRQLCCFRPALTLKPVAASNNQDGVFLNGMYELGTWDVFDNGGQRVTGYAEFLAILNNPNIMRLVADFGTGPKEIQLRQSPDGFLNYNSALSYFIPFREEFSGIPARNFRYPPEITISVSTPNMKTYSYHISMGPLISNAGGIKKYKIMQTKI